MELNSIRQLTLRLMREHGLSDWTFKWGDFVGALAKCNYRYKYIVLSRQMTKHESNFNRIKNTILHEIAHAIDFNERGKKSGHDERWQEISKSIGCTGAVCGDTSGIDKEQFFKWIGTCPSCDKKYFFEIKPKNDISCSRCYPKYNPDYKLDLEFNRRLVTWESFRVI